MKIIKTIAEKIREEISDAEEYAKLAMTNKANYPEMADVFLNLSKQELTHANLLHEQAERLIRDYRASGKEIPAGMQAVYDWEHGKMIDGVTRIKMMQDMIR